MGASFKSTLHFLKRYLYRLGSFFKQVFKAFRQDERYLNMRMG